MKNLHKSHAPATKIAGLVAATALLLSACGQAEQPASSSTKPGAVESTASTSTPEDTGGALDQGAMLATNEQLAEELGDRYVQGWIEGDALHVSTNDEAAMQIIKDAGAIGHLVDFSAQELRDGISKIMKWQSSQKDPALRTSIHSYTLNPESGGLTLSVDPAQREAVETALAKDKPAGDIPLDFKTSGGIATPAVGSTNG